MKPREVMLKAFEGGRPDRVPVSLFGGGMWSIRDFGTTFEALAGDPAKMTDMLVAASGRLLCDIVYAGSGYNNFHISCLTGSPVKFREVGAPDLVEHVVHAEEDLAKCDIARIDSDPTIETVRVATRAAKAKLGDEYVVTLTAWGPFTLAARLVGEETMMKATFKKPDFVRKVIDFATDVLIRLYEPLVKDGTLQVISLADPTASGDLISKKQFVVFAQPALKRFTDWARGAGAHTLVHICGDTTDRLDTFPGTGASCISLDHKVNIARAKEVLGGTMCFAGNVDPVKVMLQGTVEDVGRECRRIIETAGLDGGFVLMPGCDIPPTVPYENIRTFIGVARDWRL